MPGVLVAAILDYVNIMLPHVNADDPIGFVNDHAAIGIRSEMTASRHFAYLHGGHLENVSYFQLFLFFIGFVDHESMEIYIKIVFLTGLEAKILPKTSFYYCRSWSFCF